MIEEECNVNLSLAVGGAGDAPSSRSLQQKKKNTLPFHFHSLFVRAQPKEEEEEAKDVDCGGGGGKRKKLRLSTEQLNLLEESFRAHTTLAPDQKQELAQRLQLQPRQVEVWFQNRRARTKLKQTEVDCEFLKKCCERLTHENRRLKTELTELRSLKPGSQFHVELRKAARLRVCSSCEKMVCVEEKSKNRALS